MDLLASTERKAETVGLSKTVVAELSPRTRVEPDAKVTGLYKRTFLDSGEARWAVIRRPAGSAKTVTVTLGDVKQMSVSEARQRARRVIGQLADGINPNEVERQKRAAERAAKAEATNTLLHVGTAYLERCARHGLRTATIRGYRSILNHPDLKAWHARPVNGISAKEVEALIGRIRQRAPVKANRTYEFLSAVFKLAVRNEAIPASPIAKIDRKDVRHRERPRERSLVHPLTGDMAELLAVWRGVDALEPAHHPVKALVKLLILTGVRVGVFACSSPGQIAALTWRMVKDLDKPEHARIEIPAELRKTGGRDGKVHVVPLSPQAVKILQGLAYVGPDAPIFTVDGKRPLTMSSGLRDQLRALADKARGEPLAVWTVHDLRRSMRTGLAFTGCPKPVADLILDHANGSDVDAIYNQARPVALVREWLQRWADKIEAGLPGQ